MSEYGIPKPALWKDQDGWLCGPESNGFGGPWFSLRQMLECASKVADKERAEKLLLLSALEDVVKFHARRNNSDVIMPANAQYPEIAHAMEVITLSGGSVE